jgi:acetyl-CoA carboxylase biotin carboxyl carrier protein
MVDSELTELDITDGENKFSFKRGHGGVPMMVAPQVSMAPAAVAAQAAPAAAAAAEKPASNLVEIRSPMVGTFYSAPSPDSPAFASVGTAISDDSPVCIIEAMKVMNEIKAEAKGVITQVMVENAKPVEFGQPLFKVRPA